MDSSFFFSHVKREIKRFHARLIGVHISSVGIGQNINIFASAKVLSDDISCSLVSDNIVHYWAFVNETDHQKNAVFLIRV